MRRYLLIKIWIILLIFLAVTALNAAETGQTAAPAPTTPAGTRQATPVSGSTTPSTEQQPAAQPANANQAQQSGTEQNPDQPTPGTPAPIDNEEQRRRITPEIQQMEDYINRDRDRDFQFSFRGIIGHMAMNKMPMIYMRFQPAIRYKMFSVGLDLNLEILAEDIARTPYANYKAGDVRKDEWKQLRAYPNKILFLTFGDRYDYPVFVHIGRIHDYSLGNGFLIDRYNNNLYYPDMKRSGIEVKVDYKFIVVEGFCSDIADYDMFGGRIAFRPFGLTDYRASVIGMMEIGFVFVADLNMNDRMRHDDKSYVVHDPAGPSLKAYSIEFYMPAFKSKAMSLGVYFSIAKILELSNGYQLGIKGDIADGLLFYRAEGRYNRARFLAPLFKSQWDVQKKLRYFGASGNLGFRENIENSEYGGSIFLEFKNMWMKRKIGFFISYEMFISGEKKLNPHFQFGFFMNRGVISDRVALRMVVDKVNINKTNAGKLSDLDTILTAEITIMLAVNVDISFSFIKSYTENPQGEVIKNEVLMLETRITF